MNLVCNAGPIIALAKINQLPLLEQLGFSSVVIPQTVFYEILAKPGIETVRILEVAETFLKVCQCPAGKIPAHVDVHTRNLDPGELEVALVSLSLLPNCMALLDDAAGRRACRQLDIPVMGFAGILLLAKQKSLVCEIAPYLREARSKGYWLSDGLIKLVTSAAGE